MVPKAIKTRTMIDALHDFRDSTGGRPFRRIRGLFGLEWRILFESFGA